MTAATRILLPVVALGIGLAIALFLAAEDEDRATHGDRGEDIPVTEIEAVSTAAPPAENDTEESDPASVVDPHALTAWVEDNPVFTGLRERLYHADIRPFSVFREIDEPYAPLPGSSEALLERRDRGVASARRSARIAAETHRRFRELFVDPRACDVDLADTDRVLQVLVVSDAQWYQRLHQRAGSGITLAGSGIYQPGHKRVVCRADAAQWDGGDELRCAGDRVQNASDQTLAALVASQLLHEYQALHGGAPLAEEDGWDPVPPPWIVHGVAGLLAGFEVDEGAPVDLADADVHHGRILLFAAVIGREHRAAGGKFWNLADLVRPRHTSDVFRAAVERRSGLPERMYRTFCAQSWAFAHFCWYYDGGKYRQTFRGLVHESLRGETLTPAAVAASFGVASENDWGVLHDEYFWYWDTCMNRAIGPKIDRAGKLVGWWKPETVPPQGALPPEEDD